MSPPSAAAILVTGMLITGCSNSLWSKFQDKQCVANCANPDPATHKLFEQPVWQTLNMFVGEACCMAAFYLISCWSARSPPVGAPKGYAYTALPRDSVDGPAVAASTPDGTHGEPDGQSRPLARDLLQPAHLKPSPSPTAPLALHGPTPTPLVSVIEPELLVDEDEGAVPQLVGLQKMVFWLPTLFDICGTTLMNAGLLFVPVSVFQMIRGALPLWVGLFSIVFLGRRLSREKWLSLLVVTSGVALVGFAGSLQPQREPDELLHTNGADDGTQVVLGIFLIFFAQLFTASQFVIEEKIMTAYQVAPLEAVGLEGVFGLLTTVIAIPLLHYTLGSQPANRGGYFDAAEGIRQITGNPAILLSSVAIALSIALFNFCGLAVTKTISATVRSVIDTCRSIGIWTFSLAVGWETFSGLQLLGFAVLVLGTFLFNEIMAYPEWFRKLIGTGNAGLSGDRMGREQRED